ncbi:MgtC/SapB family protein [Streptomyces xanthochromogenes]|uniref:Membrane protein n=1 Tax=Streptomyces xanthochromogenes TaxID=67384 RepID=A0ABQ3AMJ2_9ACTN|nr:MULTISPECIES: MgtC/SapB family protein [Streptomyces]MYV91261.1 MgtC/SapB family protein [Streptomyces sp. SID1034]GGY59190.1 membrane protein [Streptomyces xanthochromogenes]
MVQVAAGVLEPSGQGWVQAGEFGLAFLLSAAIGLEREIRQKAAGLRTYTTVGVGSALFTLVSKYGFGDVLSAGTIELDPSRVTAQIVSGVGFIGAGVIFVHRGSVQGLTTAATIWLTAAVGAAAAAGLPLLSILATAAYFLAAYLVRPLVHRLPQMRSVPSTFRIAYEQRPGLLRELMEQCERAGFSVAGLQMLRAGGTGDPAEVLISAVGRADPAVLTARFADVANVVAVTRGGNEDE